MPLSVNEFHEVLFQDIVTTAEAKSELKEDSFFGIISEYLVEAGEIETADRAYLRTRGLRIDGYGGDPADAEGILSLLILDFSQDSTVVQLSATAMGASIKRATGFLRRSLDGGFRDELEETSPAFGLADLIATRWSSVRRVKIILATNKLLSSRVSGIESDMVEGRTVAYDVWDIGRLQRYVSAGQAREDIVIDLIGEFGGALRALPAHLPGDKYGAYLVVVPGSQLADIYDRWGPRLLEQNVRVFLQARSKVNKGMKVTLDTEPGMFFAYNNGITATATKVEYEMGVGGLMITNLHNLQIVNGGQTTASIFEASRRRTCDMSQVFVQMKLSVIEPQQVMDVVPKISEFANSQNKVNAADFFANHPFHVRIEGFSRRIHAPSREGLFRQTKWFYERARGQYLDARANLTNAERKKFDLEYPKVQMFTKTDLSKYLMVWEKMPHIVSLGAQKNFAQFVKIIGNRWKGDAPDFNDRFFHHSVAKAIIFKRTERLVSLQDWYSGGYRANIVAYALSKIAHDVQGMGKVVDFDRIWKEQDITPALEKAIIIAAKRANSDITDTPVGITNVTEWAKKEGCWNRFRDADILWPKGFLDELLMPGQEKSKKVAARREQREWTEVEAQVAVARQGNEFWNQVRNWGKERKLLSPDEFSVLEYAVAMPRRSPSGKQSIWILRILERLQADGCTHSLEV